MNISVQVDDFAFHLLSQRLIFLTPLLLAAGRAYAIGHWCLSGCLCVIQSLLLLQFFSNSHVTWQRYLCVNMQKTVEQTLEILILQFLAYFWNFIFKSLLLLQFFSDSHETWHTWSMCQYAKKTAEQIFKIWLSNFLANFWNFTFGLSLCSSSVGV